MALITTKNVLIKGTAINKIMRCVMFKTQFHFS